MSPVRTVLPQSCNRITVDLAMPLLPFCHSNNNIVSSEDFQVCFAGFLAEIPGVKLVPGDPINYIIVFWTFITILPFPRFMTVMVTMMTLSYYLYKNSSSWACSRGY